MPDCGAAAGSSAGHAQDAHSTIITDAPPHETRSERQRHEPAAEWTSYRHQVEAKTLLRLTRRRRWP
ncbi:hypothetical protein B8V81_4049 [Paenibacillus pasadenensis]|uniref:Uncharacterized protein n=1 Tax=Paenibacillus pasadenensis TaxID=217090 RepID=A0A2N5N5J5_9BACL|nr:hypothetical protein B8V81_4049 [Paenibacillus pasadenensis]